MSTPSPELGSFSTSQLVEELLRRPISRDGFVQPDVYKLIAALKPISSVDIIPVRTAQLSQQIGIILRATGPEAGKYGIIGGNIDKNEPITQAMARHLRTDLGITSFRLLPPQSENKPFWVQPYFHQPTPTSKHPFDPGKHSIGLTFLVEIDDQPQPKLEAGGFLWINEDQIPEATAYNQGYIMRQAFVYMSSNQRES